MSKYGSDRNSQSNNRSGTNSVETRIHPTTGKTHPYEKLCDFISRFPVGFRGCYNYGKEDHFSTKDCPLVHAGTFDKMIPPRKCGHISLTQSVKIILIQTEEITRTIILTSRIIIHIQTMQLLGTIIIRIIVIRTIPIMITVF